MGKEKKRLRVARDVRMSILGLRAHFAIPADREGKTPSPTWRRGEDGSWNQEPAEAEEHVLVGRGILGKEISTSVTLAPSPGCSNGRGVTVGPLGIVCHQELAPHTPPGPRL